MIGNITQTLRTTWYAKANDVFSSTKEHGYVPPQCPKEKVQKHKERYTKHIHTIKD
jgi:hypothetical protein